MSTNPADAHVVNLDSPGPAFERVANTLGSSDGEVFNPLAAVSSGMATGNAIVQFLKLAGLTLARAIIAPAEVVLRRQFGERYFNGIIIWLVLFLMVFSRTALGIPAAYVNWIGFAFFALVSFNRWLCFFRDRKGDYWHSYFEGESWIRFKDADAFFAKYYFTFDFSKLVAEPLVLLALGFVGAYSLPRTQFGGALIGVYFYLNPLGVYLIVAGVALFFYQLYCYAYRRELILNEKDAAIIAEARALARTPATKPGVSQHRGVAYVALGGLKTGWKA